MITQLRKHTGESGETLFREFACCVYKGIYVFGFYVLACQPLYFCLSTLLVFLCCIALLLRLGLSAWLRD